MKDRRSSEHSKAGSGRPAGQPGAQDSGDERDPALAGEWLVTNALGGYAAGSLSGVPTRRFHGLLIAALPPPHGRTMMLNDLEEEVETRDGRRHVLGRTAETGRALARGEPVEPQFHLDAGLPVWRFSVEGRVLEKRVVMPQEQNTVHVRYRLAEGGGPVRLRVWLCLSFRRAHGRVDRKVGRYRISSNGPRHAIRGQPGLPPLRIGLHGRQASLVLQGGAEREVVYRLEQARGYDYRGPLWSPGHLDFELEAGAECGFTASTEPWSQALTVTPAEALHEESVRRKRLLEASGVRQPSGPAARLVLAADQFLFKPLARVAGGGRAHPSGNEVWSVVAGYYWFLDWGRDTMISLEGLTLDTGRPHEAVAILRTFADTIRDGLVPDRFPEGSRDGFYETADASLWYVHAVHRYAARARDHATLRRLLPGMVDILDHYRRGTRYGIRVDPADGLVTQGTADYPLTWMDAKTGSHVVTPRRGKAVEINALWHQALCLVAGSLRDAGDQRRADELEAEAARVRASFNRRFWYQKGRHLYDVVDGPDGDDASLRPNQILAVGLPLPVLDRERWPDVVSIVERELLTPNGLRSLAPDDPRYRPRYHGDVKSRDAAYHQGTVWAWLLGPFVDAWLRLHPGDRAVARRFLAGAVGQLDHAGRGTISEVFDGEAPYTPRGCVAQAWSVAEVLRCWRTTAEAAEWAAPAATIEDETAAFLA